MAAKKGTWIGGTAFVAVAVAAGTWFLGVSPQMGSAADLRAQTEQVKHQNDLLELQIASLEAESEKLPEYEAELEGIRVQIPTTAELSDYLRQVHAMAAAHAVFVTNVAPGTAQAFVPAVVAAPAPEPSETADAESDSPTDESTDEETPVEPAAPTGPRVPDGFAAIPLSVTVLGTYDNTLAFLNDLQTVSPRLFLVSALTATAQKEAEPSGGKPATAVGDQELVITGYLYVLPQAPGTQVPEPEPTDPSATPSPAPTPTPTPGLPAPVPGKNPLVPIGGD